MRSHALLEGAVRWTLVGLALGLNFGSVGPVASGIADAFDTSLGAVGLLTTAMLITHAATQLPAAGPIERRGPTPVVLAAMLAMAAANLLAAAAPAFAVLLVARLLAGCATGPGFVASLEGARQEGGALLAGIFGGAATLGMAVALAAGGLLDAAGASWRGPFLLSAALAVVAVPLLLRRPAGPAPVRGDGSSVAAVLRNAAIWRLALLHTATFGTSLIVTAWLVEYLVAGGGLGTAAAGLVGTLLLGLAAAGRPLGGLLAARGRPWPFFALGGAGATAAGLGLLVLSRDPAVAVLASVVAGIGFALPFAVVLAEAARLEPARAASAVAFVNLSGSVFALAAAPLVGVDLDHGGGALSFGLLAALALVAGVANRRAPVRPVAAG